MPTRDVVLRIIGRDDASPAFAKAGAAAESMATRVSAAGDKAILAGRKLTQTVTLPVLALGAAAVKMATDFNASMTRIQTQAGASARDVQILSKQVLAMKDAQQGPNELASALYHLKSVGLDNKQAMVGLRQSMDLANVGGANLEETTNALAGAWRTGIKGAQDFHQAAATVNAIIGAGNMTLEDFNAALGTGILPSAKTFGLTLKDVGSALALFTDEGIDSASAATRLRMSFSLLAAPSMAAEKVLRGIGISGHQLGEQMRKPDGLIKTIGLLKDHLEGLNNYYPNSTAADNFVSANYARFQSLAGQKMKDLTASQRQFVNQYGMAKDNHEVLSKSRLDAAEQSALLSKAFGGGRSSSAILSLINNYDVLLKKQNQVTASLGKYDHAVKVQQATPEAVFKEQVASLEKSLTVIGTKLLPVVVAGVQDVAKLAGKFDDLSSGQKKFAADALLVAVALGPVLSIGGRLVKMFVTVGGAAKKAALFMAAPYRAAAVSAETSTLVIQEAELSQQLAAERSAALIAVAEADKATSAAESAFSIALSLEGTSSVLAADSAAAASNAIDFAAAQQVKADAAVKAAAETDVAWTAAEVKMREQMALTTRSTFGLQSAVTGLGIGLTVGAFTRGASTSTKLLSDLGSAAAGAAIGFSMGGPIGAAIGGLGAGLSSLATQFLHMGPTASKSAKMAADAMQTQLSTAQDLLGTLRGVNGAYNQQYKMQLVQELSQKGVLAAAVQGGVNPQTVVKAALGGGQAVSRVQSGIFRAVKKGAITDDQGQQILSDFIAISRGASAAEVAYEQQRQALGGFRAALKPTDNSLKALTKDLHLTGTNLRSLAADYRQHGDQITAVQRKATAIIHDHIQAANDAVKSDLKHGKSIQVVAAGYERQIGLIEQNLVEIGFQRDAVDKLIGTYGRIPPGVVTYLEKRGVVPADLQAILDKYNLLRKPVSTTVDVNIDPALAKLNTLHQALSSSGSFTVKGSGTKGQAVGTLAAFGTSTIPPNTAFTVGERGWEGGVTDSMGRASIFSNTQSRAMGFPTPYANGTGSTAHTGGQPRKVWLKVDNAGELWAAVEGIVDDRIDGNDGYQAFSGRMKS